MSAFETAFSIGMGEAQIRFPTPLDKLLYLRAQDGLNQVRSSGLAYIAQRSFERSFATGEALFDGETPVDAVHFLVEGRVETSQEGVHLSTIEAPGAVGFFPTLSVEPVRQRIVALEPCVTLELPAADMIEVFEEDFLWLEEGLRQMTGGALRLQRALEVVDEVERSAPEEVPYPREALDLVQRIQATRRGGLEMSNLEPVVQLARCAEEVRVEPGHVFWEVGDGPGFGLNVVYGVIRCESASRTFRMGPGSSVGHLDAYSREPRTYRAVAETKVVALRGTGDDFFDILEDHVDLAMMLLRQLAAVVGAETLRAAKLGITHHAGRGLVREEEE